ncbi:DUF6416 domain-containing protein [Streptomyces sp. NPDC056883]|uniref:DUF6416 domain-containing protein n=1 Tax=Streptomyces sp. NPDC056883 TaxID=3345959 RepID=UPI00369738D2
MGYLDEGDPRWAADSGGEGHWEKPEWGAADGPAAAALLAETAEQSRLILEYLVRHPGLEVHCTELVDAVMGGPNASNPANRVAGALAGMGKAHAASGRRLPFYWWAAPEGSTGATYAVKPSVAAVFLAALLEQARHARG